MEKTLVVSNYNWDLEWLKMTYDYGFSPENTVIYDKSDVDKDLSHLGEVIKSPNVGANQFDILRFCLLYTSPSPRDRTRSRMPSSA